MSESKHSKGPWWINGRYVHAGKKKTVAECPCGGVHHGKVDEANARLIAAAPDLLEALDDCERELSKAVAVMPRRYCNQEDNKRCEDLLDKVRAAIAKATGGR